MNWIVSRSIHSSCFAVGSGGPAADAPLQAAAMTIDTVRIISVTQPAERG
jgi:hypothetical protein